MKKRLDILVYENGFTDSREKAKAVIMAGQITRKPTNAVRAMTKTAKLKCVVQLKNM